MNDVDNQLAALLAKNADLFDTYELWANGQTMLLAGTVDDPASFNAAGGKTGALGYYPVANASGQTVYVPCIARQAAPVRSRAASPLTNKPRSSWRKRCRRLVPGGSTSSSTACRRTQA